MSIRPQRIKYTGPESILQGPVVYWMSRDQRAEDNWGLVMAQDLSRKLNSEMAVVFCLATNFLEATERQYDFMFKGLQEVENSLRKKNIPFYLLQGDPVENLAEFLQTHHVKHLVYDFDPLRIKQEWQQKVLKNQGISFYEVDSHNIVPARFISAKREFGAYTFRPKIHKNLEFFLEEFPQIENRDITGVFRMQQTDWEIAFSSLNTNHEVKAVKWLKPGSEAAKDVFEDFRFRKLSGYAELRNDPNKDATSNLSPYLHFGQLSAQRIALEMIKQHEKNPDSDSFLEELIVRRELSDNYCLYNPAYDKISSVPDWAAKTLEEHRRDEREYIYSPEEFEEGATHEELWNAAQNEMRKSGKMHGYMRMYWAKKILEWSSSPEEAMKIAVYLNDKYQLDGRDPNGYTGCAWAIAGVHDRAWTERPVYGKIRYMNYNGARRKFDVDAYCLRWNEKGEK